MTTAALCAVALALGGWAGIRWAESGATINRGIAEVVMSTELKDDGVDR